jgi:hypothetical protein
MQLRRERGFGRGSGLQLLNTVITWAPERKSWQGNLRRASGAGLAGERRACGMSEPARGSQAY